MSLTPRLRRRSPAPGSTPDVVERAGRSAALAEDLGRRRRRDQRGDHPVRPGRHRRLSPRGRGVVAGLPVARAVLDVVADGSVESSRQHVHRRRPGRPRRRAGHGRAARSARCSPPSAPRSTCSATCPASRRSPARWVDAVAGTGARVRDTRKTTPGLRALEKYAVRCGGGVNQRMGLSDAALVKDNHVLAAGGVAAAFAPVRERFPSVAGRGRVRHGRRRSRRRSTAGADLPAARQHVASTTLRDVGRARRPAGAELEATGGLTLDGARAVAETGVDYLSVGALTHSAPVLDIGLDLRPSTGRDS